MGGILSYLQDILGGDSVLVNKKEWGGFCPGGILSGYRLAEGHKQASDWVPNPDLWKHIFIFLSNWKYHLNCLK